MTRREVRERRELYILSFLFCMIAFAIAGCSQAKNGEQGVNGKDGESCYIAQLDNGAEIKCGGNTRAIILNGEMITLEEIVNPCGIRRAKDEIGLMLPSGDFLTIRGQKLLILTKEEYCEYH